MKIEIDVQNEFMNRRNENYLLHHGPVTSPKGVVLHNVYMGRQLGKTTAMLNALPDKPCVVVVHSHSYVQDLK